MTRERSAWNGPASVLGPLIHHTLELNDDPESTL